MKKTILLFILCALLFAERPAHAGKCKGPFITGNEQDCVPAAAMCKTHIYNIGKPTNNASSDREAMNTIVALKSELITRELKKQYDYLDATVKRFKMQLQKAVLVAQNEAVGAAREEEASAGTSQFDNCSYKGDQETITCIRGNLTKYSAAGKNVGTSMKKSMNNDASVLDGRLKAAGGNSIISSCPINITSAQLTRCLNDINGGVSKLENETKQSGGLNSLLFGAKS